MLLCRSPSQAFPAAEPSWCCQHVRGCLRQSTLIAWLFLLQDNELQGTLVTRLQRRVDGMQKIALKVRSTPIMRHIEASCPVSCPSSR